MSEGDLERYRFTWYRQPHANKPPLEKSAIVLSAGEQRAMDVLDKKIYDYMCHRRNASGQSYGLKDFLLQQQNESNREREKSAITTLGIIPESADNVDSLKAIVDNLRELYGVGTHTSWLPVVGDQKVFASLQKLKRQYGEDLDWLIPMLGDWHVLKNFQPVLMKLYYHAGLRELAQEAGHKGANLTALEFSSNFKHTQLFLLEAFEGCYLHALDEFVTTQSDFSPDNAYAQFMLFLRQLRTKPIPKLWVNFLQDAGTYVKFWLSLRCSSWDVRVGCIKEMATLFHAFDKPN